MPQDSKGKFHMNSQLAQASDKMKAAPMKPAAPKGAQPAMGGADDMSGTDLGHRLMSQAHETEPGKHMHVRGNDDGTYTSHHVGPDGAVQGPHDYQNIEDLKANMEQFLSEEEHGEGEAEPPAEAKHEESGLYS